MLSLPVHSSSDAQLRHIGSGAETSEQMTLHMMTLLRAHVHYIKKKVVVRKILQCRTKL